MPNHLLENGDSPELEALFDSIARQTQQPAAPPLPLPADHTLPVARESDPPPAAGMYGQIGQLTRKLHEAMQATGSDASLERVVDAIPDAMDRLSYIATLTESAAERVLNATDIANPIQDELASGASQLHHSWNQLFDNRLSVAEFKTLSQETHRYLAQVPDKTRATSRQLMDIVMAQDFQDLTGQVIKKMMATVKDIEQELVTILIDYSPGDKRAELSPALLNGPVIHPEGRNDVVTSQQQVDDLLDSLGF